MRGVYKEGEMNQCIRITFYIGEIKGFLDNFVQKYARKFDLQGVAHLMAENQVRIVVCSNSENIDNFIDKIYEASAKYKLDDIQMESFVREKDFRGVFRVVM